MPSWTTGLLDDDSVSGGRALPPAIRDLQAVRRSSGGEAVGCLVVSERDLAPLAAPGLPVHLAVTGGAGALEAGLRWVADNPGRLELRRVSVRLRGEAELAHNARRVVTVLDSVALDDAVEVYAAPPDPLGDPSPAWLAALDELAAREVGVRLPADAPWALAAVDAALDREQALALDADDPVAALALVRHALDGEAPADGWLAADPDLAARTRRWCRVVITPDLVTSLSHLP
ncbi:hypothetical protein [Nocardioides marmoraquaticus]